MIQLISDQNLVVFSSFILIGLSLLIPLITKNFLRAFLSLILSIGFFINTLIIDQLYLRGMRFYLKFFTLDKFDLSICLEPLGLIFINLISILWTFALMYTTGYLRINKIPGSAKFIFYMNLCILTGIMLSLAANLMTMFIFYEILSLVTIPLIIQLKTAEAIANLGKYLKILFFTSISLLLPAILLIYHKAGHGNFILAGYVKDYLGPLETQVLLVMLIFGISKAALVPMHGWLVSAMIAPYPVSALLHAVIVVKAGLFCIFKILLYVFGIEYLFEIFKNNNWLVYILLFTVIYSSLKASKMQNIKMILAYSTINHLGITLLSSFLFTPKAMLAAIIHLITHSFAKICLFYGMGNIYSLKKTINLADLRSIGYLMPKTSLIIIISMLSLIGLPPFGGFISKFYILSASVAAEQYMLVATIIFSSILSAYYFTKILYWLYIPQANNYASRSSAEHKLPFIMKFSLSICIMLTILFFIILPSIFKLTSYIL